MCIVALCWQVLPDQPLLLLSNRDEFLKRPSKALAVWDGVDIIAGQDLQLGGTWLGMSHAGRWAVVTNFREQPLGTETYSRGRLITDFLTSDLSPMAFARALDLMAYAGFSLIVGDQHTAVVVSNRGTPATALAAGVYVLSNGQIDEPWHKVERLRQRVTQELLPLCQQSTAIDDFANVALTLLQDKQRAPMHLLPKTGISPMFEKVLSSIYINTPFYATRASSLIVYTTTGFTFYEKTHRTSASTSDLVNISGVWS